jgi:hypothetical protein
MDLFLHVLKFVCFVLFILSVIFVSTMFYFGPDKSYYYAFSFSYSEAQKTTIASCYIGYPDKKITLSRIKEAKRYAEIDEKAVLISCSYLGHMTKKEFMGETDEN